jgi:hypothetical protein
MRLLSVGAAGDHASLFQPKEQGRNVTGCRHMQGLTAGFFPVSDTIAQMTLERFPARWLPIRREKRVKCNKAKAVCEPHRMENALAASARAPASTRRPESAAVGHENPNFC